MPKAILELPKMPRSCQKCPLAYYVEPYARSSIWKTYACIWTGNAIPERGKKRLSAEASGEWLEMEVKEP